MNTYATYRLVPSAYLLLIPYKSYFPIINENAVCMNTQSRGLWCIPSNDHSLALSPHGCATHFLFWFVYTERNMFNPTHQTIHPKLKLLFTELLLRSESDLVSGICGPLTYYLPTCAVFIFQ